MQTPGDIGTGRHDAVVVDARWDADPEGTPAFALSLTLIGGAHKGDVVDIAFADASASLRRALTVLGVAPADMHDRDVVTAGVLGMPCTLVLVRDAEGTLGYALDP